MIVNANNLKELDCTYEIIKDCTLKDGTTLRKGSEFIIDDANSRNEVCMHFPINETNNIYASEYTNKEIWISAAHMQLISKAQFKDIVKLNKERHQYSNKYYTERKEHILDEESGIFNENMITSKLDKATKEKKIYQQTIKELSRRYDIPQDEIYNLINDIEASNTISNSKSNSKQIERSL